MKLRIKPIVFLLVILVVTTFAYLNSLNNEILRIDDVDYFTKYPEIRQISWFGVWRYFSQTYVIMYQPLPVLTFALNYYFTGLSVLPMHMVNLVFHLFNVILVYQFIKELSGRQVIALTVSLFFALHPINTEAVDWISARSSCMYTFFYLLSIISYIRYLKQDQKASRLVVSLLFFILSLLCKSQAVTLPVVLFAIDYFLQRRMTWAAIKEKIPFFILSIIFGIITITDKDTLRVIGVINKDTFNIYHPLQVFFIICYSLMFYIEKAFFPTHLCSTHAYPILNNGWLPWEYYCAAPLLLIILFTAIKFRRNKYVVLGMVLFLVTISINIQIIPSRISVVADRYAYFPLLGIYFIMAYCADQLIDKIPKRSIRFLLAGGSLGIVSLLMLYATWQRNVYWSNDLAVLTDIIEKNDPAPKILRPYETRAGIYMKSGHINEAIGDYTNAILQRPNNGPLYYNRAVAFIMTGNYNMALTDIDTALHYMSANSLVLADRAFVKYNLGDTLGALTDCNCCIKMDAKNQQAFHVRAIIEMMEQKMVDAENDLDKAISINRQFVEAYKNRGLLYYKTNRKQLAYLDWKRAADLGDEQAAQLLYSFTGR